MDGAAAGVFKLAAGESSDLVVVFTTLILVSVFAPIKARLERIAARVTGDPSIEPPDLPATVPGTLALPEAFADPAFLAAFDARTRAILAEEVARGAGPGSPSA